jgi:hypothetical protein
MRAERNRDENGESIKDSNRVAGVCWSAVDEPPAASSNRENLLSACCSSDQEDLLFSSPCQPESSNGIEKVETYIFSVPF